MKRHNRMRKWLSGALTAAMLAANLSASLFSMTALADSGWVNSGPGVAMASAQTAAAQTPAAEENILPADSPYKAVPAATNMDLVVDIGGWSKSAIKGVTFEVGRKTDWDGGGGGGIFIDNWSNTISFSFTTTKKRVFCMFLPQDVERLKQTMKLNLWWTWSDAQGKQHLKDIYIKPESVRLIVDKNAQPITQPSGPACIGIGGSSGGSGGGGSSSGGGGGSSSGGGSGSGSSGATTTGKPNLDYQYIVRDRGTTVTLSLKDIYPAYEPGDILEITMATKGGDRWNSFELSCYQGEEKISVKKPGDDGRTSVTMTANPNGGNINVTFNWLGGDYVLYGFDVKKVGEGEAYVDETLAEYKYADIIANPVADAEYSYQVDLSDLIREAAAKAEADGVDLSKKVVVTVKLDLTGCHTHSKLEMETKGAKTSSGTVVPEGGAFRGDAEITGYLSELSGLYWTFIASKEYPLGTGTVAKVKEITVAAPDPYKTTFTSSDAEKVSGTEKDYEMDLSNLFQKAIKEQLGTVAEGEELEVTVKLTESGWVWNKLQMAATDGTKESAQMTGKDDNGPKSYTVTVTGAPTEAQSLKLRFMSAGSVDGIGTVEVESITVKRTGNIIDPTDKSTFTKDDAVQNTDANGYWTIDLTQKLQKAVDKAGLKTGDKVKIIVNLTEENTWAWSKLELAAAEGTKSGDTMEGKGTYEQTLTGTLKDDTTLKLVLMNSDAGSIGTIQIDSITVEKDETPDQPVDPAATTTWTKDTMTPDGYQYSVDLTAHLKKALTDAGVAAGTEVEITAEVAVESCWTYNEIMVGSVSSGQLKPSGNLESTVTMNVTAADDITMVWKFYGSQQYPLNDNAKVTLKSLTVKKTGEVDPAVDTTTWTKDTLTLGDDGYQYSVDLTAHLKKALEDAGVTAGTEVEITAEVAVESCWTYNQIQVGSDSSETLKPSGKLESTVTMNVTAADDITMVWKFYGSQQYPLSDNAKVTLKSLTAEATTPPVTTSTLSLIPEDIPDEDAVETASASNATADEEQSEPESKPDVATKSDAEPKAEPEAEPEAGAEAEAGAEPEADAEPENGTETPAQNGETDPQNPDPALKPADDPQKDEGEPEGGITNEQEKEEL